jgi:heme/copper-type cytochrome/quinol oxidase subunit 2
MGLRKFIENKWTFIVSEILLIIGASGFLLWLIKRVIDGKGIDLYRSNWGINYSSIGILTLIVLVVVVMIVGSYLSSRQRKEEFDLLQKYSKEKK